MLLELASDYIINVLNNKGATFRSLGDLQASLSNTTEALNSYQQVISVCTHSLRLAPDDQWIQDALDELQRKLLPEE